MTKSLRTTLACAVFLVVAGFGTPKSLSVDAFKCPGAITFPGFDGGAPVFVVGGEVMEKIDDLEASVVQELEIVCWKPATGQFTDQATDAVAVVLVVLKESGRTIEEERVVASKALMELYQERTKRGDLPA